MLFGKKNGEYISALRLEPYRDGLLLEALETKPVYRKMGYASTLMEAVKRVVSKKIYSHVGKWNTASLAIHEKCGFQRILEYVTYADGSVSEKSCTMCLEK